MKILFFIALLFISFDSSAVIWNAIRTSDCSSPYALPASVAPGYYFYLENMGAPYASCMDYELCYKKAGTQIEPVYMYRATPTGWTFYCSDGQDGSPSCPSGQHFENVNGCVDDAPDCDEPERHPCDMFSGDKAISCKVTVSWDLQSCKWISSSCAEGGPFGGYSSRVDGAGSKLGSTACLAGCMYKVTEESEKEMRVEASGESCTGDEQEEVAEETTECLVGVNADWCPDKVTGTNCGTVNGEPICIDPIPAGTCVSSPNGAVVCVSPPEVEPDTPKPVNPDIHDQINGLGGGGDGTGNNINIYGDVTIDNGGGLIRCPTGSTYKDGQCQTTPGGDGTCPPGYTKYAETLCIYDGNKGGKFSGPGYTLEWSLPDVPEYDYSAFMNGKFAEVQNAPILSFLPSCGGGGSSSCPKLTVMGQETDIHCRLAELIVPVFEAYLNLFAAIAAARIVLSA